MIRPASTYAAYPHHYNPAMSDTDMAPSVMLAIPPRKQVIIANELASYWSRQWLLADGLEINYKQYISQIAANQLADTTLAVCGLIEWSI